MSFSRCAGSDAVCYSKPLDSLKGWNDHFFWVDAFACPTSFPWHTGKSMSKDPFPKSTEFNAEYYASLVAYTAPFHKYLEPFFCLMGLSRYYTMDENTYPEFLNDNNEEIYLLSFIRTADPSKVRIGERQRGEDEPKLLDTTIGCVVPLLPVAPARGEGELEDSVDKLFDEGGSDGQAEQGDSASSGQGVGIQLVSEAAETSVEDVVPLQQRRQRKRKTVGVDSGEPSYPAKKLREDHRIPGGTSVAGKSMLVIQWLLAGTVTASERFVISSDSSHHSGTHVAETEVDSLIRSYAPVIIIATTITVTVGAATVIKETTVKPSLFATSLSSAGGTEPTPEAEAAKAIRLRAEASKFEAVKKSFEDEIRSLKERNTALEKEKGELDVGVGDLAASVKVREQEVADLDAMVTSVKSHNGRLVYQVHELETSSARLKEKVTLDTDFVAVALYLEEKLYPRLLTTMVGRRWLLTYGMKLAIVKCLHSPEYLSALRGAISKAIEKGMQDGIAVGITHGQEAGLVSNKDASIKNVMNILRLEETLAERLGLNVSQPHVDQLMIPIHQSRDQTVIGATSLSFSLDVSHNRVQNIRDNIANHRSALHDVFVPLSESLSSVGLEGTEGTSGTTPATTTALSTTFASRSSIPPISTDDYEVLHTDGREGTGADVNPFPNVDDAELNTS
ncbi:hypothetical protein Tco_0842916 [Tanacetum coccineum]|uniref:Transposase (Putative), gypsy type n=1 Tax=Tanacetum coccineum TaxID=301880 RepID=A0ABQ5B6B3_9ASTR